MKVKILGAGSIGNHLANASRALEWSVDLCDIDISALERTRNMIYPGRYGQWDEKIRLFHKNDAPIGGYDLICIGTPPDSHVKLALEALEERPRALLIEKPLCGPNLESVDQLCKLAELYSVPVFIGYDHVVGKASRIVETITKTPQYGCVSTLDVEFREHWGGIFNAHPWLSGPGDTYLGYWVRGGGASGEHSHAINLWQHIAHTLGAGRVTKVQAVLDMVDDGQVCYDKICSMNLVTERGLVGRCIQDVVTQPPRKWARVQFENGYVEWHCGIEPGVDQVTASLPGKVKLDQRVFKTRPEDFIEELRHIETAISSDPAKSPISIARGLDTMMVIAAVHLSHRTQSTICIDYSKGYCPEALVPA